MAVASTDLEHFGSAWRARGGGDRRAATRGRRRDQEPDRHSVVVLGTLSRMDLAAYRPTPAQIKQAEQTAAAIFVTAYLLTRGLEFVFGRLAVGARFVRQGMETAVQDQLSSRTA